MHPNFAGLCNMRVDISEQSIVLSDKQMLEGLDVAHKTET